ncbi:MAG: hypothetical protein V4710_14900 [Verrucomicrobiota bacterium]
MDALQKACFEGFTRVSAFGELNAADLIPAAPAKKPSKAQKLLGELGTMRDIEPGTARDTVIGIVGRAAKEQRAGNGEFSVETESKSAFSKIIIDGTRDIKRGMAAIARAQKKPHLLKSFRLPRGSATAIVAQARAIADAAEPFKEALIELELAPDFIETLRRNIVQFGEASNEQERALQGRMGAKASIEAQIEQGLALVGQLDVIMRNKYKANPQKLTAWLAACRISRTPATRKRIPAPSPVRSLMVTPTP